MIELREERNAVLHARSPSVALSLRELPERLNAVRDGIGGLLCELQTLTGSPLLRFMLRLRSAGEVTFTPRRASASQGGHGSETGAIEGSHAAEDAVRP